MNCNKKELGTKLEDLAADYLEAKGAVVVRRNFRCRGAEIDIIVRDGRYLCFVEVKYRKDDKYGGPESAVDYVKRKKICKASRYYTYLEGFGEDTPLRYDVLAIMGDEKQYKFKWIKDAFEYVF